MPSAAFDPHEDAAERDWKYGSTKRSDTASRLHQRIIEASI